MISLLKQGRYKFLFFRLTLIDILAAAQTEAALKVLIATLDFSKKTNTGDIERGLTGISFSSHPTLSALEALAVRLLIFF